MFKHHNITITPGKAWRSSDGTQHPPNWHLWGSEDKKKWAVTEIVADNPPDSRLYNWALDSDGKITSTAKPLYDSGSGESLVLGLKSILKNNVKDQQGSLLSQTDWAYIRHYDSGTEVPANIETWRNAIRVKATEMEKAIDDCSSISDVEKLWLVHDKDGNKSGILYDWPELEE